MRNSRYPAAFINAIAEEGTKEEAIFYLQETWDELQDLKRSLRERGYEQLLEYKDG
jgi:hypothetical protein